MNMFPDLSWLKPVGLVLLVVVSVWAIRGMYRLATDVKLQRRIDRIVERDLKEYLWRKEGK